MTNHEHTPLVLRKGLHLTTAHNSTGSASLAGKPFVVSILLTLGG